MSLSEIHHKETKDFFYLRFFFSSGSCSCVDMIIKQLVCVYVENIRVVMQVILCHGDKYKLCLVFF